MNASSLVGSSGGTAAPRWKAELVARLEAGELELPLLPQAAMHLMALCSAAECDARELSATIERDPALASHVLRVANSAVYASNEPIVSLAHAVSRFGFATLSQIACAVAVGGRVFQVEGHESWVAQMWRHAALAGAWAREIARVRRRNVEGAFLCGLLHDVGMPVLLQASVDAARCAQTSVAREELEPMLDELHERAGALLARGWKMAPSIASAIESHHARVGALGSPLAPSDEALNARLADLLAHWSEEHADEDAPSALARWQAWPACSALNLYADDLAVLYARRAKVVEFAGALS